VLRLVAQGLGTRKIADQLFIGSHTVLNHIRNSRGKLQADTKLEAVVTAMRYNLL
jgi:DNA-binding CsgD family transcriptional regulator